MSDCTRPHAPLPSPDGDAWAALDAALSAALDLEGDAREAYLAALDSTTRDALAPLLQSALADDPLLDHAGRALSPLLHEACAELARLPEAGSRVGPYRLEALVGEGGMGRVYRARRADGTFEKTVAVKVVRAALALAGADVADRLRRERALLATLDHPGIARLLDGGETDDGVPYLITEFVEGAPLTDWAERRNLDVPARLRLVVQVARAVDHAHRRFVVHRDLKPSNVLVTESDGAARPVVLDFGIAKLLDVAEEAEAFPLTRTGMHLLTPAYAAPELFGSAPVTTAVDVYGLGALLYELLTRYRPHSDAPLPAGLAPATEPTRPSQRVLTGGPEAQPLLAARSRVLRGDLDVICLKALHPDPTRRYASAAALADDIERYLSGRPVHARPDSLGYVVARLARRHQALAAAVGIALLSLLASLSVTLFALGSERAARAEAEAAASRAGEAADLLAGVFDAADPRRAAGRDVTAREALDRGLQKLAAVESGELRGYLAGVLGRTYYVIGDRVRGDSLLEAAIADLGAPGVPPALLHQALLSLAQEKTFEPDRAVVLLERARSLVETQLSSDPVLLGHTLAYLAIAYSADGRTAEGIAAGQQAVETFRRAGLEEALIHALRETGSARARLHRGGIGELREAVALARARYGPDAFTTGALEERLAWVLLMNEAYADALPLYERALARNRSTFGRHHLTVSLAQENLGHLYVGAGRYGEAIPLLKAVLETRALLPDAPASVGVLRDLATAQNRTGQHAAAEASAHAGLASQRHDAKAAPDTERTLRRQLGLALYGQGRYAEALPVLEETVAGYVPPDFAPTLDAAEHARALAALRRLR